MHTPIVNSCVEVKEPLAEATEGLQHAVRRGWLVLHYQPRVDLRSAHVSAVEAQLYWRHSALGDNPSIRFMSAAKTIGLTEALAEWTIREVCEQGKKWQEADAPSVRLAVNVCAEHMACSSFVFFVAQCLSDSGLAPDNLEFVLAVNDAAAHADKINGPMRMLKELGVSLSIANVGGMGAADMDHVKNFPVDRLKLDGSVVHALTTDPGSLAILDAIIATSHQMGLEVIADQVETEEQVTFLTDRYCDQVQGGYYRRTLAADAGLELLQSGSVSTPDGIGRQGQPRTFFPAFGRASRYFGYRT